MTCTARFLCADRTPMLAILVSDRAPSALRRRVCQNLLPPVTVNQPRRSRPHQRSVRPNDGTSLQALWVALPRHA